MEILTVTEQKAKSLITVCIEHFSVAIVPSLFLYLYSFYLTPAISSSIYRLFFYSLHFRGENVLCYTNVLPIFFETAFSRSLLKE